MTTESEPVALTRSEAVLAVMDTSVFHFVASLFTWTVVFRKCTPIDEIRPLRGEGLSLADIAEHTGVTVTIVRRVVGKLDHAARRKEQEGIARQIDSEPVAWHEKVGRWKQQTGQSEATFWRVLKRCKPCGDRTPSVSASPARAVGDGATAYYVQDVAVLPDRQRRGIGTALLEAVMNYFRRVTPR
jgi:ribosomal protein S18 acetylase RimI-like enzyme